MNTWPPPGYWRNPETGKERAATLAELREANRLLAKHRDIARAAKGFGRTLEPRNVKGAGDES